MANVNKVKVNNTVYDIEDTVARSSTVTMSSRADGSVSLSSASAGTSVNVPSLTNFGDPGLLEDDAVTEINTLKTDVSDLKSQIANGMPYEVKLALDNMLAHVAYNDYDSSNDYATFHAWAESINVTSISAVFTQGSEEFYLNSSLDDLKPYLVVTAYYDNGTSGTTTAYTLSGELTEGVSVITVLYGGVSTTFTVNVIGASNVTPVFSSYTTDGITTVTVLDHGIRVSNSTSKIYAWAYLPLPLKKGYTYKVSFDQTYVSGDTRVSIRDISSGDMGKALLPVEITSNANLTQYYEASGIPSDNANWSDATSPSGGVLLFNVTYATRATGNVTFDNLKVLEYLESEGE